MQELTEKTIVELAKNIREKMPHSCAYTNMKWIIYQIINIENGKRYIGKTSRSLYWRKKEHLSALGKNRHTNILLQQDFNNGHTFDFEIIQEDIPNDISSYMEQFWMLKYKTYDEKYGYNKFDTYFFRRGKNIGRVSKKRNELLLDAVKKCQE